MTPRRLAARTGPAGLAALVAVAVLGSAGGAVAGTMITGAQVKNGSLTGRDLRDGSIAGTDVGDGSLTGADVGEGSLTGGDIADGSLSSNDLADEAGVWGAGSDQHLTAADNGGVQATTTFTTEKGFVQVNAILQAEDAAGDSGFGRVLYRVLVDGRLATPVHQLEFVAPGVSVAGTVATVVPVSAGTHTVTLLTTEVGTGSVVETRELTALYAPSGGSTLNIG